MIDINSGSNTNVTKKLLNEVDQNVLKRDISTLVNGFFKKGFNRKEAIGNVIISLNLFYSNEEKERILKNKLLTVLKPVLRTVRYVEVELDEFIEKIHKS